jgi:sugar phosphate isomerase/epimerase
VDPKSPSRPKVHVHVPFADFTKYELVLRERRLSVELYFNSRSMDTVTEADLHRVVSSMDWEHTLSVHGPFMDLSPGAVDSKIAAASLERYLQVISFCHILRPEVVVFHSGYEKWKYAGEVRLWLDQSRTTWLKVMDMAEKAGVRVAIENIVDEEPGHLRQLVEEVAHPMFGLCLDVGHREIFSSLPIAAWVEGMHPHIFELHLHDNIGDTDSHMPIGAGRVDFGSLFAALKRLSVSPVYTVEAHSADDALASIANLSKYLS